MDKPETILSTLEILCANTLKSLRELTPENFETNFNEAYKNLERAKEIRANISLTPENSATEEKLKKVVKITKLIAEEYDNILEKYSLEIDIIEKAIKTSRNKRKMLSYSGGA